MHCIIMTQFTFHRLQELKFVTQLGSSFGIVHKGEWNQSDDATTPVDLPQYVLILSFEECE